MLTIITGVGRCGTSLVAGYLKEIGWETDSKNYYESINAGHESVKAVEINSFYIKNRLTGAPDVHLDEILEVENMGLDFIKDPSFLAYPKLILEWNLRLPVKIIMMHRDPISIVMSCRRAPFMNGPNYRNYTDLIEKHENEFIKICQNNNIELHQIQFPDVIDDPKPLFKALGYNYSYDQKWNDIADQNKVNV